MADDNQSLKPSQTKIAAKVRYKSIATKKMATGSKNTSDKPYEEDDDETTLQQMVSKMKRKGNASVSEKDKVGVVLEEQTVVTGNASVSEKDKVGVVLEEQTVVTEEHTLKQKDQSDMLQEKEIVVTDNVEIDEVVNNVCKNIFEETHQKDPGVEESDKNRDKDVTVEDTSKLDSTNAEGIDTSISKTATTKQAIMKRKGLQNQKDNQPKKKKIIQGSKDTEKAVASKRINTRSVSSHQKANEENVEGKNEKKRKRALKDKGKEKVEENDGLQIMQIEEIENSDIEVKEVNKKGKQERRKGKQKVIEDVKYPTLKIRTSPNSLYLAIQNMSNEQKDWVRSIGFESILELKIDVIPSKMAFYIVNNLDCENLKLHVAGAMITITSSMVHDVFGLPIGGVDLFELPLSKKIDITAEWLKQYDGKPLVRPMQIMEVMKKSKVNDFNFRMNFITLFMSTMVDCSKMGCCNISFLKYLRKDTDLKTIDWCKVMIDFLKTSMYGVTQARDLTYYTGPITFLTLLYVDYVSCSTLHVQRQRPTIKSWNSDLLSRRETAETNLGCFGLGKLEGQLTEDEIIEGFKNTLNDKLECMMVEKVTIEKIIEDCKSKYPSVDFFAEFQVKFEEFFGKRKEDRKDEEGEENDDNDDDGNDEDGDGNNKDDGDKNDGDNNDEDRDGNNQANDGDGDEEEKDDDGDREKKDGDEDKENKDVDEDKEDEDVHANEEDKNDDSGKKDGDGEKSDVNDERDKTHHSTSEEKENTNINDANSGSNVGDKEKSDGQMTQIFNSPTFHQLCDKTVERYTRVTADGAPSYSLGYSPLDIEMKKKANEEDEVQKPVKRQLNLGPQLRSPYKERVVDISVLLKKEEKLVSNMIIAGLGKCDDVLFEVNDFKLCRGYMEMLVSGYGLQNRIIDAWVHVLNDCEKYKSDEAPRKLYLRTAVTIGVTNFNVDKEQRYNRFKSNLNDYLSSENMKFRHHDLLFFALYRGINFYLVVFNLKKGAVVIIDNDISDKHKPNRYNKVPNALHEIMVMYLKEVNHPSWEAMSRAIIEEIDVLCCTKNVKCTESGIYTMRHMETYKGEQPNKWKCGIHKETSTRLQSQLHNLRLKYTVKILLSEVNTKDKVVVLESMDFGDKSDEEKNIQYDFSSKAKIARLKNFRLFGV
ncbi:hypothetical protein OSB04_014900 [Centaurea solstitialis]|uniref:Uncharacterized protein n=1 Tax=Centaurea solstitialis TaxID=347529 RepID=A0AA38T9X4_9ASTR|nr:hypothetical protein OSB04_014900 [Centaurea solstitialis]